MCLYTNDDDDDDGDDDLVLGQLILTYLVPVDYQIWEHKE